MHESDLLYNENSTCSKYDRMNKMHRLYYIDLRPLDLALVYNNIMIMNDKI